MLRKIFFNIRFAILAISLFIQLCYATTTTTIMPSYGSNSLGESMLHSFNEVPMFGWMLMFLAFGIAWARSKNIFMGVFWSTIIGFALSGLNAVDTGALVWTIVGSVIMVVYFVSKSDLIKKWLSPNHA